MKPQDPTARISGNQPCDPPRAILLVYHGTSVTHVRLDADTPVVIGRDPEANVVIQDASLSRTHARLVFNGKHDVIVKDLGSTNGTILKGHNLDKPTVVPHGSEIYFGSVLGIVHIISGQTNAVSAADAARKEALEGDIVMNAPVMQRVVGAVRSFSNAMAPVVIGGETGTGKEEIARLIHRGGPRKDRPFVILNCASISPPLLESMLFGHEKGAFTGATAQAKGFFEEAHGGTILLDEIGELSATAQSALLRVLETGRIVRIGSVREIALDFRLIAATWRDLKKMSEDGTFRQDLFHRISVLTIDVPPLRSRREDIPTLAGRFLQRANKSNGRKLQGIDDDAMRRLVEYDWPGNIRELRNWIERAVVVAQGERIDIADFPVHVDTKRRSDKSRNGSLASQTGAVQQEMIEEALRQSGNDTGEAARLLGISRRTLQRLIKKYGIATRPGG